jgi:hypothetical protein
VVESSISHTHPITGKGNDIEFVTMLGSRLSRQQDVWDAVIGQTIDNQSMDLGECDFKRPIHVLRQSRVALTSSFANGGVGLGSYNHVYMYA